MPLSEFRKNKLLFVFRTFFDADKSGNIDKKDFEVSAERICRVRGWESGSAKANEVLSQLLQVWEGLRAADVDNDGSITEEEWCQMWDKFTQEGAQPQAWQKQYCELVFSVHDTSGDGTMDEDEFIKVCSRYGVSEADCKTSYAKFTQNNTVTVNKEIFAKLWKEFFTSEDPSAPGNFIFGKSSF